jgi:hypothetical protein
MKQSLGFTSDTVQFKTTMSASIKSRNTQRCGQGGNWSHLPDKLMMLDTSTSFERAQSELSGLGHPNHLLWVR